MSDSSRFSDKTTIELVRSINNFRKYIDHLSLLIEQDPIAQANAQQLIVQMDAEITRRMKNLEGV